MERVHRAVAPLFPGATTVVGVSVERTAYGGDAVRLRAFRTQKYVRRFFLSACWIESKNRSAAAVKLATGAA